MLQLIRAEAAYQLGNNKRLPKHHNLFCKKDCLYQMSEGKLQCKCGEDFSDFDWRWNTLNIDKNLTRISNDDLDVVFHPLYSSGTAISRGPKCFLKNRHYYWEVKVISQLYGTDTMIGVSTKKNDYFDCRYRFCSYLGLDDKSYGYSYRGRTQHAGVFRSNGKKYNVGSLVGIHLDMYRGTLEFYLNRKPLGISFKNLKQLELYPVISSTAAQSHIRLTCSISQEISLQNICLAYLMNYPQLYERLKDMPGFMTEFENKYFWFVPRTKDELSKRRPSLLKRKKSSSESLLVDKRKCTSAQQETDSEESQGSEGNDEVSNPEEVVNEEVFDADTDEEYRRRTDTENEDQDSEDSQETLQIDFANFF